MGENFDHFFKVVETFQKFEKIKLLTTFFVVSIFWQIISNFKILWFIYVCIYVYFWEGLWWRRRRKRKDEEKKEGEEERIKNKERRRRKYEEARNEKEEEETDKEARTFLKNFSISAPLGRNHLSLWGSCRDQEVLVSARGFLSETHKSWFLRETLLKKKKKICHGCRNFFWW